MPSPTSRSKNVTADELYEEVTRKVKAASSNITKRKLESGEYVMHNGRIVPASLLEAAQNLIAFVKSKYPGEELYCPYMKALDEACVNVVSKEGNDERDN